MTSNAERRLMKDLKRLHEGEEANESIQATPSGDSLFHWEAVIFGPDGTIFEDGIFNLTLEFPEDYPNKPPKVKFLTKLFHPNIYASGAICLDILKTNWSPVYDVRAVLTSIQSLLTDPNPNSPANPAASKMFMNNYQEYVVRVKACVEQSQQDMDEDEDDNADEEESKEQEEDVEGNSAAAQDAVQDEGAAQDDSAD